MAHRRNAADGIAGVLLSIFGVCLFDLLTNVVSDGFLIDPVGAAGDHQHRPVGALCAEDQRFGDLADIAADGVGSFLGSACGFIKFHDLQGEIMLIQNGLHALG